MNAIITIRSNQLYDDNNETIELVTEGTFEPCGNGFRITYEESAITEMEGITTSILVEPSKIVVDRTGGVHYQMVFEKGNRNMCHYDTGYGTFLLSICTDTIENEITSAGGSLNIEYSLEVDNAQISDNVFYIEVKAASALAQGLAI